MQPWHELAARLTRALHLATPPIAITFSDSVPAGIAPFDAIVARYAGDDAARFASVAS